jgi:hypothetical protein
MVTRTEASGMNWFTSERDMERDVYYIQTQPSRFADLAMGHYAVSGSVIKSLGQEIEIPSHFETIVDSNSTTAGNYVVYSNYDVVTYTQVWGVMDRFNYSDFDVINHSPTVNKMYDNGNLRLFLRNSGA